MAVSHQRWRPISLSIGDPRLTHLCFVDDLFTFTEASMDQMEVISECLDIFCASSSHKISKDKTRIFFSNNVHHVWANEIASAFGFTLTNDLGKYLGVPLHHSRVKAYS